MATFKDKEQKVDSTTATHDSDVETLQAAVVAEANSIAAKSAAILDFSAAIHGAPGGFVVDATGPVVTLFQSPDGQSYTRTPIASITDTVPDPEPVAPVDPTGASPPA